MKTPAPACAMVTKFVATPRPWEASIKATLANGSMSTTVPYNRKFKPEAAHELAVQKLVKRLRTITGHTHVYMTSAPFHNGYVFIVSLYTA